jgi:hypothetical protein
MLLKRNNSATIFKTNIMRRGLPFNGNSIDETRVREEANGDMIK